MNCNISRSTMSLSLDPETLQKSWDHGPKLAEAVMSGLTGGK